MAANKPQRNKDLFDERAHFKESLKSIIKNALVEKFDDGDQRPCNESDFSDSRKKDVENFTSEIVILIKNFLNNLSNPVWSPDIENELLALILILCGQNVNLHPWNTGKIVKNCEAILFEVMKFFSCRNARELLIKTGKVNLTKAVFQVLCSDLKSSTWKNFPASVACFKWILEMIEQPDLRQHLQFVLPPALVLTDDYVNENRITGVRCLNHIIQNITVAELKFCSYGNVIYSALLPLLRIRESELIDTLMPPLISLITKLEFGLKDKEVTKWSRFDDILEIFLENMELEQLIDLRNSYISNLDPLINASKFGIIRWSKRLLRIFHEYIRTARKCKDEYTVNHCIKVIKKYINFFPEIILFHAEDLLCTLVFALHYARSSNNKVRLESTEIAIECIKILFKSLSEIEREQFKKFFKTSCKINFEI